MQPPTMLEAFKNNPIFIAAAALVALIAIIVGLVALLVRDARRTLGVVAVSLAIVAVAMGGLGLVRERARLGMILDAPGLSEHDKERVREYNGQIATLNLEAGIGVGAPGLLLGLVAIALGKKKSALRG